MTAGYPARTDQQIKDRRTKVKARRKRAGPDTPLVRAIRRRDELEAEKEWVLAEIQAVSVELTRLLREELGGLDQSPEGD